MKNTSNTSIKGDSYNWSKTNEELFWRLFYILCSLVITSFFVYKNKHFFIHFALKPLYSTLYELNIKGDVTFLEVTEAFYTQIQITFYLGAFFTIPIFWLQSYMFFCPGMYEKEQKIFRLLLMGSWILLFLGFIFTIKFLLPQAWKFFLGFLDVPSNINSGESEGLWNFMPTLKSYLGLIFEFLFCILVSSQLPLAFFLFIYWYKKKRNLEKILELFLKGRPWAIIFFLSWGALVTPPDLWSQILFFIPTFFFYELVIFIFFIYQSLSKKL